MWTLGMYAQFLALFFYPDAGVLRLSGGDAETTAWQSDYYQQGAPPVTTFFGGG